MMRKFTVIIVDDEKPARELIRNFLKSFDELEIIDEADNGFDGCLKINGTKPDLVFLDVQMPKLTGIEMLDILERPLPFIIFSTAYDQYAVQAFEKNALDYLLKPYSKERFNMAIRKFIEKSSGKGDIPPTSDQLLEGIKHEDEKINRIPVRSGSKIHVLKLDDVRFIEAQDDYIKIHSTKGAFLKQQTMKHMERNLPDDIFVRIHRSYILNINFLNQLEIYDRHGYTAITSDDNKLPVSRQGAARLKKAIHLE